MARQLIEVRVRSVPNGSKQTAYWLGVSLLCASNMKPSALLMPRGAPYDSNASYVVISVPVSDFVTNQLPAKGVRYARQCDVVFLNPSADEFLEAEREFAVSHGADIE